MFCALLQKGTIANNIKNIFFINIWFYRLPPPTLDPPPILPPLEPELKLPLLRDDELLLGLLIFELLLFDELLLGLLTFALLVEELLLGLLTFAFLFEELELGLTYSELERTCLLLFAGEYVLRSDDEEAEVAGLVELLLEDGLLYLFCAFDTLSLAFTRGVVVLIPLLEGRALLASLVSVLTEGLADDAALSVLFLVTKPAEEGRLLLL